MKFSVLFDNMVNCVDDISILDKELVWFSNGNRGFLHANKLCHKLNKGSSPVISDFSVRKTRNLRVCDKCALSNFEKLFDSTQVVFLENTLKCSS